MYPRAADLTSKQVQSYSDQELFWIINNGTREGFCRTVRVYLGENASVDVAPFSSCSQRELSRTINNLHEMFPRVPMCVLPHEH